MTRPPNQDGKRMPLSGTTRRGRGQKRATDIATATPPRNVASPVSAQSRAESRFAALAEATSQIVWIVAPDGMHDQETTGWQAYTGLSAEQAAGWGWLSAIHPDDRARAQAAWAHALATQGAYEAEYSLRRADGEYRLMWVRGVPVRDANGVVLEWVGTAIDITERVALEAQAQAQAQAHAREVETVFDTMLDTLLAMARSAIKEQAISSPEDAAPPGGVTDGEVSTEVTASHLVGLGCRMLNCARGSLTTVGPDGRLRPLAVVGLSAEDASRWRHAMSTADAEQYLTADEAAQVRAGLPTISVYAPARARGHPTFGAASVLLVPLMLNGALVGVLTFGDGATPHTFTEREIKVAQGVADLCALVLERQRLLREQAASEARALASEETKRQMDALFALASHELRTPLTVIKATTEVAQRRANRLEAALPADSAPADPLRVELDGMRSLLDRALKAVNRQDRLVNDLLDVSRIQLGRLLFDIHDIDLAALVRETTDEMRLILPMRDLHVVGSAEPVLVRADGLRMRQVLANYISNACKFSPEGSPVTIMLAVHGATARVSVRDEGSGIAHAEQDRIWDQFYQVPTADWTGGSQIGLGLGLYLSHEIIVRLGGRVGVDSELGRGSTFWCTLPVAAALP